MGRRSVLWLLVAGLSAGSALQVAASPRGPAGAASTWIEAVSNEFIVPVEDQLTADQEQLLADNPRPGREQPCHLAPRQHAGDPPVPLAA